MGWLHCFVEPDWTLSTTARPLDSVRGRLAETVIMRASDRRKNAIKQMSMSNPPMFQCCHILTKVRTDAGGIIFDLLGELEIQDDASWRIILTAKKSLGDISLFVAL